MEDLFEHAEPITPAQTRRLHSAWRDWAGKLGLAPEADAELRHYYVRLFSGGTTEAWQLSRARATHVITWLERLAGRVLWDSAAGTAGRKGFPERRRVRPNRAAWRALWATATALGMDRERLRRFIASRYTGVGLRDFGDIRTMADLNRVLWGLKAMLRRQQRGPRAGKRAA